MATVYLHIGAPKTATSTLQAVLASNHKKLLSQGILYPRDCCHGDAHHVLVCDLIAKHTGNTLPDLWYGDFPRGQAWQALVAEIDSHGAAVDTVILSSELFFGQVGKLELMLADVKAHLAGHEIKILTYLRRQDQLYSSFYNQDVKGARQWPHSAYEFYETHQIFQRSYYQMLQTWASAFGTENILVRPYEPQQWEQGSIVSDFCHSLAVPPLRSTLRDQNESLGPSQLYVKRCLNRVGYDKAENDAVLKLLAQFLPEKSSRDIVYINAKLYSKYRKEWDAANRQLADEFLDTPELFHTAIPALSALQAYQVDTDKLQAFLGAAVKHFGRGKDQGLRGLFARAAFIVLAEKGLWHTVDATQRKALLSWVG